MLDITQTNKMFSVDMTLPALKVVDLIAFLDVKSLYSVGEGVPCS